jgi:hypothetical protein
MLNESKVSQAGPDHSSGKGALERGKNCDVEETLTESGMC